MFATEGEKGMLFAANERMFEGYKENTFALCF
jgi:hypothetical protein